MSFRKQKNIWDLLDAHCLRACIATFHSGVPALESAETLVSWPLPSIFKMFLLLSGRDGSRLSKSSPDVPLHSNVSQLCDAKGVTFASSCVFALYFVWNLFRLSHSS